MRKHVLAVVGLLALGGVAMAQGPGPDRRPGMPPGPPRGGDLVERLRDEVGLSDQQMDQIRRIHLEARKAAIRNRADREIARLELRELMESDSVDTAAVQSKVQKLSELQAGALRARVDALLAARKVMTAEQFQKAKELRRRGGDRGRPGPPRGPRRGALDLPDEVLEDEEEAEAF